MVLAGVTEARPPAAGGVVVAAAVGLAVGAAPAQRTEAAVVGSAGAAPGTAVLHTPEAKHDNVKQHFIYYTR